MQIENLYKNSRKKYINIMSRILRDDRAAAEDVVQEAFTRSIKFYHSYNSDLGKLETWFNKILFNALRDYQQEMRGQPPNRGRDFSAEDVFSPENFPRSKEFGSLLHKRVMEVNNEKHQRVLYLFFILGYTSTEINQIEEKVSVSSVTTIVGRFREKLVGDLKWR